MNKGFIKNALPAAISLAITACGGGAASVITGIGGSGLIATGTVTGFGSVFVNGVEFETDSATFVVDGASGTQSDLAVGMVVQVSGSVNSDGVTGTATEIVFDDQLQGPVTGLVPSADGENLSFVVLGITVRVNSLDTLFDDSAAYGFDDIVDGNNVEISGFFNPAGELVATRVELKDAIFSAASIIELRGTISNLANTTFNLGSIIVDASAAAIDDLPGGPANDALVEVKGTFDGNNTITATRVEGEDSGLDDTVDDVSIEGIITDYDANDNSFTLNGVSVNASGATLSPATMVLRDGLRVEAEGPVSGGVLQAVSVELRSGDSRVHATVDSVDQNSGDFVVRPVSNGTITIDVTTSTELEDPVVTGSFVRVRGFENDSGGLTATRVDVRSDTDDVIVQGTMQAYTQDVSITVLGVDFQIQDDPFNSNTDETDFQDVNDSDIEQSEFINATTVNQSLVKVKDREGSSNTPPNGIADEIEIETP